MGAIASLIGPMLVSAMGNGGSNPITAVTQAPAKLVSTAVGALKSLAGGAISF